MSKFSDIANEFLPNFHDKGICPDQYVGIIENLKNIGFSRKPVKDRPDGTSCLILILESPHKKEFNGDPEPAKGATGRQIQYHLLDVEGIRDKYSKYGLILVNAIQFQCSLGESPKEFRNLVFRRAWQKFGEQDFIRRLKKGEYYHENDVVVNCCTQGKAKNMDEDKGPDLRVLVKEAIRKACPQAILLCRCHPCTWNRKKYRQKLSY